MLLEALVLTVCVQGHDGCSQGTSAYYEQSKELKELAKNAEKIGKRITENNQWLVYVGSPIYALASHQPAKILLFRGTVLSVDPFHQGLGLQWSY
jgi:hypothetical protein